MTTLIGDLQSIMGTPFGGEGHAVLIFSRVSRAAFQSGAVIIELHDRIPMPKEAEGRFTVEGLDPGPIRVELEGGTVHGHGWNVDLPEEGEWHLADLMDAQVEWSPAVVGRAESAARNATQAFEKTRELRDETEGFRDETFQKADAALNDAANLVRGEFESLTERAETGASTAAEQAGVAAGHAEQAGEDRAQTGADRRQTGEDRAQTGRDAEAAEGWASQSKDAATLAITAAATVTQYVGDGFPEGKVSAPVGSIYVDRQATAGAVRWTKASGTGNTGWQVEYGDTGWRLLPNMYDEPEQTGQVFIRRIGDRCSLRVVDFTMPGEYARHIVVMPSGFRSQTQFYGLLVDSTASSTNSVVGSYTLNRFSWARSINGGRERPEHPQSGEMDYLTDDAWPSTLPGTPF